MSLYNFCLIIQEMTPSTQCWTVMTVLKLHTFLETLSLESFVGASCWVSCSDIFIFQASWHVNVLLDHIAIVSALNQFSTFLTNSKLTNDFKFSRTEIKFKLKD